MHCAGFHARAWAMIHWCQRVALVPWYQRMRWLWSTGLVGVLWLRFSNAAVPRVLWLT
jgi:hypothetical protein